jgi:hypothetical protein
MFYDEKGIKLLEKQGSNWQEIASPDFVGVIVEKSGPVLTGGSGGSTGLAHIFLNSTFGDFEIEFE